MYVSIMAVGKYLHPGCDYWLNAETNFTIILAGISVAIAVGSTSVIFGVDHKWAFKENGLVVLILAICLIGIGTKVAEQTTCDYTLYF